MLIPMLLLVGCTSVAVKQKFPEVPTELLASCSDLKQIQDTTKLSQVITVVVENYGQYHECKIKNNTWAEWYKTQREIYNK
jgi:hypothetical protein